MPRSLFACSPPQNDVNCDDGWIQHDKAGSQLPFSPTGVGARAPASDRLLSSQSTFYGGAGTRCHAFSTLPLPMIHTLCAVRRRRPLRYLLNPARPIASSKVDEGAISRCEHLQYHVKRFGFDILISHCSNIRRPIFPSRTRTRPGSILSVHYQ
ncbi:unnamed protein product [Periconia digitata]|uniref:Uncharacterized protein n=1 Tax=Periconia digitata TaxID=1303443 RepID=A0A9W4U8L1_9PLEO|nr:unnamed protein product [Periconia digitata]